jgi:hypothetical protein
VRHPLYEAANRMLTRYRGFCSLKAWGLKIAKKPRFALENAASVDTCLAPTISNVCSRAHKTRLVPGSDATDRLPGTA